MAPWKIWNSHIGLRRWRWDLMSNRSVYGRAFTFWGAQRAAARAYRRSIA